MRPSERKTGSGVGGVTVCVLLLSGLCLCRHDYHFVNKPKVWNSARIYCKTKFTALASIHNDRDAERLKEAVGGGFQGKVWIGLSDKPARWKWAGPNPVSPSRYNFSMWHEGQPNQTRVKGKLCVVFRAGTWYDHECTAEFAFVCYDENPTNSSVRFVLVEQEKTWREAGNFCRTNHTELATIRDASENAEVRRLVGEEQQVWVGLFRYTWTQWAGANSNFNNWLSGHPKELRDSCATSLFDHDHHGEWVETKCRTKHPFVCHQTLKDPPPEKKHFVYIKISALESTIDLNHPAVTRTLLERFQRNMGEIGDVRVSWRTNNDEKIFSKEKKKKSSVDEC